MAEPAQNRKYTYSDYLTWDDDKRYELIDGEVYMMSPAPVRIHQRISMEIARQLANYLRGKTCEVYPAPFDVRLNADTKDDTVIQPDITVVCDPKKLDDQGCKGAPDMIIEILSPSTARRDQRFKFHQYLKAGVREYWIVYPDLKNVQVNLLADGKYSIQVYGDTDIVPVHVLEDCQITLADVFLPGSSEEAQK